MNDLTVVEVGQVVSAPLAGMMFSDMGAEVIKIERVGTGDPMRHPTPGSHSVGNFEALNRGKKSVELNLKSSEGKQIFRSILSDADVLIENLSPGAFDRLGLPLPELVMEEKNLIVGGIKGYGNGPYENRLGMDHPIEVESGITYMTGLEGRPLRVGFSVVDFFSAMQLVLGAMTIYANLPLDPEQRMFRVGMFETASLLMIQTIATVQVENEKPTPLNESRFRWAVYDYFATKDDEQVFLGLTSDEQWERFCAEFDLDLLDDPELQTEQGRVAHRESIQETVSTIISTHTQDEITEKFDKIRVTYAPFQTPKDLLSDPHLGEKFLNVQGDSEDYRFPGLPNEGAFFTYVEQPNVPRLGEHTREYLEEAGYTPDDIQGLRENGVIGDEDEA